MKSPRCSYNRMTGTLCLLLFLAITVPSMAEDVIKNITVGHDFFTTPTPDPKVPVSSVLGAKYGFNAAKGFKPYLGTGIAYTLMPEIKTTESPKIKTGVAAQAGANYQFGNNFSLSLDYKYLYISPDPQHGSNDVTPQSIGVGVNIKF